jgi:hypothetical protein
LKSINLFFLGTQPNSKKIPWYQRTLAPPRACIESHARIASSFHQFTMMLAALMVRFHVQVALMSLAVLWMAICWSSLRPQLLLPLT